jgi:hypothetical protein
VRYCKRLSLKAVIYEHKETQKCKAETDHFTPITEKIISTMSFYWTLQCATFSDKYIITVLNEREVA